MYFAKYNINPKKWHSGGDCVVRALCYATQTSWEKVYDELCYLGKKKCRMPNDPCVYKIFLKKHGFIEHKQLKNDFGSWLKVKDLINRYQNVIIVIHCAHHLTAAINGFQIDTWDCTSKPAGKFYIKPIEEKDLEKIESYLYEHKLITFYKEECNYESRD